MKLLQIVLPAIAMMIAACGNSGVDEDAMASQETKAPDAVTVAIEAVEIMPGLSMRLLREGTGPAAKPGDTAVVHYTGWLYDQSAENHRGNKFDSSIDRGTHFEFPLGAHRVIRGWDEGVVGMKIGELRELTIAPELAYGDRQVGDMIPPGSTLVFEVELAGLKGLEGEPIAAQ
jgi:FKBP-type peptidyl-prolyl cis-trans isomerase